MDRRSWLWRRKSTDKSPAETETSASSASERITDEQVRSFRLLASLLTLPMLGATQKRSPCYESMSPAFLCNDMLRFRWNPLLRVSGAGDCAGAV
jgi:hypothetical protein